jgi:ketosteroid isomerase-like protein
VELRTLSLPAEVTTALAALRAALAVLTTGDPGPMKALYSHRDDATGFFGWGSYVRGWPELDPRWDWAAAQFVSSSPIRYEELAATASGDLAYVVWLEHSTVQFTGASEAVEVTLRATHVLRREDGVWRLVHRHADALRAQVPPGASDKADRS